MVEVRDSATGYCIPVRYGIWVWPDGRIVGVPSPPPPSPRDINIGANMDPTIHILSHVDVAGVRGGRERRRRRQRRRLNSSPIWPDPWTITPRDQISCSGSIPHFDHTEILKPY